MKIIDYSFSLMYNKRLLGGIIMENICLDDLDNEALIELMSFLEGMNDELKEENEADTNE